MHLMTCWRHIRHPLSIFVSWEIEDSVPSYMARDSGGIRDWTTDTGFRSVRNEPTVVWAYGGLWWTIDCTLEADIDAKEGKHEMESTDSVAWQIRYDMTSSKPSVLLVRDWLPNLSSFFGLRYSCRWSIFRSCLWPYRYNDSRTHLLPLSKDVCRQILVLQRPILDGRSVFHVDFGDYRFVPRTTKLPILSCQMSEAEIGQSQAGTLSSNVVESRENTWKVA